MLMIAPMLMIAYMHTVQHLSAGTIKANKQTNMSMQAWTRISNIEIAIQPIQTSNRNNNKQRKSSSLWKIYHRFGGKYCFAYSYYKCDIIEFLLCFALHRNHHFRSINSFVMNSVFVHGFIIWMHESIERGKKRERERKTKTITEKKVSKWQFKTLNSRWDSFWLQYFSLNCLYFHSSVVLA